MTANKEPHRKSNRDAQKNVVYQIDDLYVDDPKKNAKAYDITCEKTISIEGDSKEAEKGSFLSSFGVLYAFSDRIDMQLMAIGLTCALLQAGIPPFVWLVMGSFVSFSITREKKMLRKLQPSNIYKLSIGFRTDLQMKLQLLPNDTLVPMRAQRVDVVLWDAERNCNLGATESDRSDNETFNKTGYVL